MAINVKDKLVTLESLGIAYSAEQDSIQETRQELSARIDNIVAPEGDPSLTEVSDARVSGSTTHNTLKARLDADQAAVGTEIAEIKADLDTEKKEKLQTLVPYINLIDISSLADGVNLIYDGKELTGTAQAFQQAFPQSRPILPSIQPMQGTRYALRIDAYTDGNVGATSNNGLKVGLAYVEGSPTIKYFLNDTSVYTTKDVISTASDSLTLLGVFFGYGNTAGNIWHVRNIMLVEGAVAQDYIPYNIPCDYEARNVADKAINRLDAYTDVGTPILIRDLEWIPCNVGSNTGILDQSYSHAFATTVRLLRNINKVVCSAGYTLRIYHYDADKRFISMSIGTWVKSTAPQGTEYIRVSVYNASGVDITNIEQIVSIRQDSYALAMEINQLSKKINYGSIEASYVGRKVEVKPKATMDVFLTGVVGQDGVVIDDVFYNFHQDGTYQVFDLKSKTKIATGNLEAPTEGIYPHCNSASAGVELNALGIPYVYLNAYSATGLPKGTVYVYSLVETDGVYSASIVQTIHVGFTSDPIWDNGSTRPYGNFLVDVDDNALYAYTLFTNKTRVFKFQLPLISDGTSIELTTSDILTQFDLPLYPYIQGGVISNHQLFISSGYGNVQFPGFLHVVDLIEQKEVATLKYADFGIQSEPETVCVYGDNLFVVAGKMYKIKF